MIIIPAIDIYNGKCVRLHKGDFRSVTTYDENPLAVAQEFEDLGFSYVHIVDLDAAKTKEFANLKIIFGALTGSSETAIAVGPEKRSIIFSYFVSLSANLTQKGLIYK